MWITTNSKYKPYFITNISAALTQIDIGQFVQNIAIFGNIYF